MELLIVLVLYEMDLSQSPTFQSLQKCLQNSPVRQLHLLVYDNSSTERDRATDAEELKFTYRHDPANGGLAAAYNAALALATEQNAGWILLLDQDSVLPDGFLREVLKSIEEYDSQADVAAIVPEVQGQSSPISPKIVHVGYVTKFKNRIPGRCETEITGINSGVTVRTSFMNRIGGFNRTYWLDFMDYWLFKTIYRNGAVAVFSGTSIRHSLSLETRTMSRSRYLNMLNAEATFVLEEGNKSEISLYVARLLARALKNLVVRRDLILAWTTTNMTFRFIRRLARSW